MNINKEVLDYQIINKDGQSFHQINRMEITLITEKSYVGNLYDSNNKCIAWDRRFFFENVIHEDLSDGEKSMVKNEIPDERWSVPEIKLYLDNKGIEYNEKMSKVELLILFEIEIKEEI